MDSYDLSDSVMKPINYYQMNIFIRKLSYQLVQCSFVFLFVLWLAVPFSAASRVVVTNALWNTDSVNVRRGVNLTLVCRLELGDDFGGVFGGPPVFRIVHSHANRTLLVADNDNITSAFARLGRYEVTYSPPPTDGSTNSRDGRIRFAQIIMKINGN